ncbi:hypothetical protein EV421DRAFT_1904373 [Armillaria borealis]|uniref:Uncharacterized protein n=1 Tax=Armillaria borealis TaxID=47425 RepID=A0AA39JG73_9AGAR|nr:hypothetical protein EV421DRAFT_1904373 [Armillaria borealis]
MDLTDEDYILASLEPFDVSVYQDILDLVAYAEYGLSLSDIVAAYDDGSHPYFHYQSSLLSLLSTNEGGRLHSSMLDFIQLFELRHPWAITTSYPVPRSRSFHVDIISPHQPGDILLEILDLIFAVTSHATLLVARCVSQDWCFASSRYTHSKIVFRMRAHWQNEFDTPEKRWEAEAYAFVSELLLLHGARWSRFAFWVRGVAYHNWPCFMAPSFYLVLPHIQTVTVCCTHSSIRHFPVIRYPYILLQAVTTVNLERCSLRGHCVETLLSMCKDIRSLTLCSVHYGHIMPPRPLTTTGLRFWRSERGITNILKGLILSVTPPSLRRLVIDFPDKVGPVLSSMVDERGTPPLLLQLFPLSSEGLSIEPFLLSSEVYPYRLRMTVLEELDARFSPNVAYMFPSIAQWAGSNLTTMRLSFPLARQPRDVHTFSLSGFPNLTRLRVEVNVVDLRSILIRCSSWSSGCRSDPCSEFDLVVSHRANRLASLRAAFSVPSVLQVLAATNTNLGHEFRGIFRVTLSLEGRFPDDDLSAVAVVSVLEKLKTCPLALAKVDDLHLIFI